MPTRRLLLTTAGAALAIRPGHAATAAKPHAGPLIGAALPLSGPHSLVGDECLRGIQLAVDATNATGGINGTPIALFSADVLDQSHIAGAINGLIANNHVNLLLGTGTSELSYPGSAAAELAQIPYIELNAPADGITARGFKFLLRTGLTTSMIASVAVNALLTRFKGQKIGLLFNTGATSGAIAGAVLSALASAKITPLLSIGYPEDATDLHDPVGRLMRAGAQIVLHAAGPDDALAFFAAMAEQNWRPPSILGCGEGYLLAETAEALGSAFDNTLAIGAPFYPAPAAGIAAAYLARYGTRPRSAESLSAYTGASLVFSSLNTISDPAKLLDALRKTSLPTGSLPNGWGAAFDHSGQNTKSFATLQQWRNTQLTPL